MKLLIHVLMLLFVILFAACTDDASDGSVVSYEERQRELDSLAAIAIADTVTCTIYSLGLENVALPIIIKDFDLMHPAMENFDSRRPYTLPSQDRQCGQLPGDTLYVTQALLDWSESVYGVQPRMDLLGKQMMFGDYGTVSDPVERVLQYYSKNDSAKLWNEVVAVSKGMVDSTLPRYFADDTEANKWTETPKLRDFRCDNIGFSEWFTGYISDENYIVESSLDFAKSSKQGKTGKRLFYYHSDSTDGFFPLDKPEFYDNIGINNGGPQSFNFWCPPPFMQKPGIVDQESPPNEPELCTQFWATFDPELGTSPLVAGHPRARNYHFTVKGYYPFVYRGGEQAFFASSNDLWVFVDGRLQLDLGGTHPRAEGIIDMDSLASKYGWEKNTLHDLHYFKAERQSNETGFALGMDLDIVVPCE